MRFNYNNITSIEFYGACSDISAKENEKIMSECTIANKKEVHKLLKKFNYEDIGFMNIKNLETFWNPYKYYKSKNWIVVIHSCIDYFFKISYEEESIWKSYLK